MPVTDSDGAVDFVVWVGEDVTAVKRQEVRERLLSNASKLLASSLDVDATIDKAAWAVVPELADWARIDLRDERGELVQMAVAHRDLERVELLNEWRRDYPPAESDDRGPWEVMRTGQSIVWANVGAEDVARYAQSPRHAELMRLIATRSVLIVPMVVGDEVIGTMQLATTSESGRMLGAADLELAEELARRAAIAVDHARVHAVRTHIATTLQRSLLPPRLPVIPGLAKARPARPAGARPWRCGRERPGLRLAASRSRKARFSRFEAALPARVVDVDLEGEDLAGDLRGDAEHLVVVPSMSTPSALWNSGRAWSRTYIVPNTATRKNGSRAVEAAGQLGVGAHQQREGLAVAELVVAPLLEPLEDRVEALFRVALEVAEDGDVAGVADLLGEIGGVEDELRLEVGVLLGLGQEAEVDADAESLRARR